MTADIIARGAVIIGLPPVNSNYFPRLGAPIEEPLLTDNQAPDV